MILPDHIVLEHAPLFVQRSLRLLGGLPQLIAHPSNNPVDLKPKQNDEDEMMIGDHISTLYDTLTIHISVTIP
jgi:hypothetical protein